MTTRAGAPVVVGVDGSEQSLVAVDLAVRHASRRHLPLRVVHAFTWPYMGTVPMAPAPIEMPDSTLHAEAERILKEGVARAHRIGPDLHVTSEVVTGAPGAVLVEESRDAAAVVVGDRGLGGFTGLLVGSVAVQLVSHGEAPVLVARGEPRADGPILLAADGSPGAAGAVAFAFEEASLRGAPLKVLHTWLYPVATGPGDMLPLVYDSADVEEEERRLLSEAMAGWSEKYPDVTVEEEMIRGRARPTLIEASRQAQLAVVGARGRGGFSGLVLGSVSQAMLHHSHCPVAVVRRHKDH
jgi:nucleotide-binding universal stress UspA family protein